ncbi:OPT family oligopeptide transporter [Chitinasiproducens palmae]|uniref:Putative oligopeptide transporter, OPT family n=1 Tax=Chitinasiproducens palmae TaxID=1770053 RepID=A0A1H2PSI6_9BURK|nr:oligopeptide transporter, OPT family [Chitinasiproducens palmae]SDV49958.1 putative oligopeptide transporter, OPT family [Chitinasiproducens palmae]
MSSIPRSPDAALTEFTLRGVLLGAILTAVFTASNVYLGLKVGLTFSSAIPAAVISMAVLRALRGSTILENNMVQTQASAAGTLSSIIFVLPGLVMIGVWQGFPVIETMGLCAIGGMLGVVFTIPLRHAMVVESSLPYPEGIAAAEVLRVGSEAREDGQADGAAGSGVRDIAAGGILAAAVSLASGGLRLLADGASAWFALGAATFRLPMGFSLALMGAGYLIGIAGGLAMLLGVIIAWGVAVPWLSAVSPNPEHLSLSAFATSLWSRDVRFIGAGMIGIASLWTLAMLVKPVAGGIVKVLRSRPHLGGTVARTDQDLSPRAIAAITGVLLVLLTALLVVFVERDVNIAGLTWPLVVCGVVFTFVFGFLIAAACGYMAGLVGSSSSPISGIGIVAVILVSALLLLIGRFTGLLDAADGVKTATAFALFTTSAVIAVATISNDNLQDLKTGWLVGATPWRQQVALLIGCVVGAATIPPTLELLYRAYGFTGALPRAGMDPSQVLAAPQATLMTTIADGIFSHRLNWSMLGVGVVLGVALIVLDTLLRRLHPRATLPVLAVGIGIYLPPTIATPLVVGALIAYGLSRVLRREAATSQRGAVDETELVREVEARNRRGVLFCSGLIVGESLMGVALAAVIGFTGKDAPLALVGDGFASTAQWLGLLVFAATGWLLWRRVAQTPR